MLRQRGFRIARAAFFLAVFCADAHAFGLGRISVGSYLGQPLRAQVSVSIDAGQAVADECFVARFEGESEPLKVHFDGKKNTLLITGSTALTELAYQLTLTTTCPERTSREYPILPDPPRENPPTVEAITPAERPAAAAAAPAAQKSEGAPTGFSWSSRPGDTLNTVVSGIYPDNRVMRGRLANAIVKANPQLNIHSRRDPLPEGATLRIPDLRELAATAPPAPRVSTTPAVEVAPSRKPVTGAVTAKPPTPASRVPDATPQLKVSPGAGATAGSTIEKQLQVQADNQTAHLLALNNHIAELEAQLAQLSRAIETASTPAPVSKPAEVAKPQTPPPPAPVGVPVTPASPPASDIRFDGWPYLLAGGVALLLLALFAIWRKKTSVQYSETIARDVVTRMGKLSSAEFPALRETLGPAPDTDLVSPAGTEEELRLSELPNLPPRTHAAPGPAVKFQSEDEIVGSLVRQIEDNPRDARVWMSLLRLYHRQHAARDFLGRAVKFRVRFDEPELWSEIQAMGRDLEPGNVLYRSEQT